mgnify:CR=1 FL=1
MSDSASDEEGVIGYQATHGDARHHAADRRRRVAVDDDLAGRRVHPLEPERVALGQVLRRPTRSRRGSRSDVDLDGLRLRLELLDDGASAISSMSMPRSQPRTPT